MRDIVSWKTVIMALVTVHRSPTPSTSTDTFSVRTLVFLATLYRGLTKSRLRDCATKRPLILYTPADHL